MNIKDEIKKLEEIKQIMLENERFDNEENILASFEAVEANLEDGEGGESIAVFATYRQALLACQAGNMLKIINKQTEVIEMQQNFINNQAKNDYSSMGSVPREFLVKIANFCQENGFDYSNLCGEILSRFTKVTREIAAEKLERSKQLLEGE